VPSVYTIIFGIPLSCAFVVLNISSVTILNSTGDKTLPVKLHRYTILLLSCMYFNFFLLSSSLFFLPFFLSCFYLFIHSSLSPIFQFYSDCSRSLTSFGPNVGCCGVMIGLAFLWCIPRYCIILLTYVKCSVT
jgi:hypothetical protein